MNDNFFSGKYKHYALFVLSVLFLVVLGLVSLKHRFEIRVQKNTSEAAIVTGTKKLAVFLIDFKNSPARPLTALQVKSLIESGQIANFYRENSYGKVSLSAEVFDWYQEDATIDRTCASIGSPSTRTIVSKLINQKALEVTKYDMLVAVIDAPCTGYNGSTGEFISGFTTKPLITITRLYTTYNKPSQTHFPFSFTLLESVLAHEIGHVFLGTYKASSPHAHSEGLDCTPGVSYDASPDICKVVNVHYDVMGPERYSLHFPVHDKNALGWFTGIDNGQSGMLVINQAGTKTYSLSPLESTYGKRAATINWNGARYYLEYRQALGFDAGINKLFSRTVGGVTTEGFIGARNLDGLFIYKHDLYTNSRLLDMSPVLPSFDANADLDWNQVALTKHVPSGPDGTGIYRDVAKGITVGPIISTSAKSISFQVTLNNPGSVAPVSNTPSLEPWFSHILQVGKPHTHVGSYAFDPNGDLSRFQWSLKCMQTCPPLSSASGTISGKATWINGPTLTPSYEGIYTLTLSVADAAGNTKKVDIVEATSGVVTCVPFAPTIVLGNTANFTAVGGNGTYTWSALGGSPTSGSGEQFSTRYGTTGTKTITITSGSISGSCTVQVVVS